MSKTKINPGSRETYKTADKSFTDRQKIIFYCRERFFNEGFYKVSMDEIARELGMSKSTLYKYFPSKVEIVQESIKLFIADVKVKVTSIIKTDDNAVEKFILVIKILTGAITKFSDKWLSDLQHHAPQIWQEVDEIRKVLLYENISKLIIQGQKEKLILNYPPEIIITLFTGAIRNVVNPQFLLNTRFSYDDAVQYAFRILLNGILTEEGKTIFNKTKLLK